MTEPMTELEWLTIRFDQLRAARGQASAHAGKMPRHDALLVAQASATVRALKSEMAVVSARLERLLSAKHKEQEKMDRKASEPVDPEESR